VRIVSFEVSKSQIKSGECVRFTWQVGGAPTAIYFDGEGVGNAPDARDRCPTATKEFELRAEGHGGPVTARLTVVVQGDTEGPSVQRVADSPDPMRWPSGCIPSETTVQAYVTDESGVAAVKVVYRVVRGTEGSWQSKSMSQVQTNMYSATINASDLELSMKEPAGAEQNGTLEYRVQAFDVSGNSTSSATNTVTIMHCVIIY
jgi:hypothetical protein